MLLILQLDILSQSLARESTFLASSLLKPHGGAALWNRFNYNNGDEEYKPFTTSFNVGALLMEGNELYKMTAKWYLRFSLIINYWQFKLIAHIRGEKLQLILQEHSHRLACSFDDSFAVLRNKTKQKTLLCQEIVFIYFFDSKIIGWNS